MTFEPYRDVLRIPQVRHALILSIALRLPLSATFMVLTMHVVTHLGHSYGAAGLVAMASTLGLAISGPWRGRLLDRKGLRRTVAPSLVILAVLWSIAPFLSYWFLVGAALIGGLFQVPIWGIIRQMILHATPIERRRSALSLDSVATEIAFMIGPAVGVIAAASFDTRYVLVAVMWGAIAGASALWLLNPPLMAREDRLETTPIRTSAWLSPAVVAVFAVVAASAIVLAGTDVGIVAHMREIGAASAVAIAMAIWAAGSLVGGLLYGMLSRSIPSHYLLFALAATTIPVALATNVPVAAVLLFICGFFCAPTLTSTTEQLSHLVPARARGEAMGWHGSAITGGSALGAPVAGVAIDHYGSGAGFIAVSVVALVIAIAAIVVNARRRRRGAATSARTEVLAA
ncbi:MFS transporter [Janibacter sp. GXQ6167]|uniref:MFS transporter n=1 Tax=Janibacter sp. GXQ6167 TaxID=3240791 RepID=UPI0035260057